MNILYLTTLDPRQKTYGGEQRTHALWKALQKCGQVHTLVLRGGRHVVPEEDADNLIRIVSADSPSLFFKALDRLMLRVGNGTRFPWHAKKNVQKLVGWPGVKFDVVVCRYLGPMAMTSAWKIAPCVVDIDDYPPALARSRHKSWFCRLLVGGWTKYLLKKAHAAWIPDAAQIPLISKWVPCAHLPNLARGPSAAYHSQCPQKEQLMTVGLMAHLPNQEGVDWFLQTVWPAVHAKFPSMRYQIIGKGVPPVLEKKWRSIPGVEVVGYVSDVELDRLYEESLAVVAPILSGAGTCIKVLEAGLRQRFVYATSFARRGLVGSEGYCLNLDVETLLATLPRLKVYELSPHAPDERALKNEFESTIIRTMKRVRNGN